MSTRYGISVIPQPTFTAQVHRVRQTLCNQYGCWAAEMHPVHLPLIDYFPCPDESVKALDSSLERMAGEFSHNGTENVLSHWTVVAPPGGSGDIYLEFGARDDITSDGSRSLSQLRDGGIEVLEQANVPVDRGNYPFRIALMQHANLPLRVFESAVGFAQEVAAGLELPTSAFPWQLVLIRFESPAAGDDWNGGGWANDLSWRIINSYTLSSIRN